MRTQTNRLTSIQTIKLFQFLDARKESLCTLTAESLAANATESLGFKVVPANVTFMRREMGFGPRASVKQGKLDTLAVLAKELALIQTFSHINPSEEFKAVLKGMGI